MVQRMNGAIRARETRKAARNAVPERITHAPAHDELPPTIQDERLVAAQVRRVCGWQVLYQTPGARPRAPATHTERNSRWGSVGAPTPLPFGFPMDATLDKVLSEALVESLAATVVAQPTDPVLFLAQSLAKFVDRQEQAAQVRRAVGGATGATRVR